MPETNQPTNNTESGSQTRATVEMKAKKPAGLLPKNTQQLVILVVAVVMVLIMWLTGNSKRTAPVTASPPGSHLQSLDPAAVQDFKQSIQKDQAATRQPVSQVDRGRLEALGLADRIPPGTVFPPDGAPPPTPMVVGVTSENQSAPTDPIKEDKKKREYLSLFAPNVAFTSRTGQEREGSAASAPAIHEALPINRDEEEQQVSAPRITEFDSESPNHSGPTGSDSRRS